MKSSIPSPLSTCHEAFKKEDSQFSPRWNAPQRDPRAKAPALRGLCAAPHTAIQLQDATQDANHRTKNSAQETVNSAEETRNIEQPTFGGG